LNSNSVEGQSNVLNTHDLKKLLIVALGVIIVGLLLPQRFVMPVKDADKTSFNKDSFWYYPWGRSVTHKGVDIFEKEGRDVVSSTHGVVLFAGTIEVGGNVVLVLGPKWRLHYYAHLKDHQAPPFSFVTPGEKLGTVGTSGNAKGKAPHLHYSITTLVPYPWRVDSSRQGWKKMFYLNPIDYIHEALK
jgi:peptidoglycan LD-endopeptidase LytH